MIVGTVVVIIALLMVCSWLQAERARLVVRAGCLSQSTKLLDQHHEALVHFLDHPKATPFLRSIALDLSDACLREDHIVSLARAITQDEPVNETPTAFDEALSGLRVADAELHDVFIRACTAGMLAGIMKFPESSAMLLDAAAKIATNPRKDVKLAASRLPPHQRFTGGEAFA